jgi:hypothetical protein
MTYLKIDTEASHSMNEMQWKSEIGEEFMLKIGEGFMLLVVYILVTWLYVYCNFKLRSLTEIDMQVYLEVI